MGVQLSKDPKHSPVHAACWRGDADFLRALLRGRVDSADSPKLAALVDMPDVVNDTPLGIAARRGHADVAELLLLAGAHVDLPAAGRGCLPLHLACQERHRDVAQVLLRAGANPNALTPDGVSALHLAAAAGDPEVVRALLAAGADVCATLPTPVRASALHVACSRGSADVVRLLLRAGADVDVPDGHHASPLLIACMHEQLDVARALLEAGANVTHASKDGATPLHFTASVGSASLTRLLLESVRVSACDSTRTVDAKVAAVANIRDKLGSTPLHLASITGADAAVALLLQHGACANAADADGLTPMDNAEQAGHARVVEMLRAAGGRISECGGDGGGKWDASQLLALGASLAVCALAVLYADWFAALLPSQPATLSAAEQEQLVASLVFESTKRVESDSGRAPRLAFCCSADLDVSVRAVDLMQRVARVEQEQQQKHAKKHRKKDEAPPPPPLRKAHHERITSLRDLQESFAFYFANGAAAEQSMSSPEQFREVVKFANELAGVTRKVGGNAATMADRAAVEGCDVLLGAAIGREMRKHLNANIALVGHLADHEHEDVHLVLEYSKGDAFRAHVTPRANRYYLNHDIYNARLSVLEDFERALEGFAPDLVVFGGLQLMEVETDEERRLARLTKLSEVLQNLFLKQVPSHYEFAAVSGTRAFGDLELYILHHYLVTGEEGTATNSRPTVAQISAQLHDVISFAARAKAAFQQRGGGGGGNAATDGNDADAAPEHLALAQLSRIHFHTLQFHIMCQQQDSVWGDPTAALVQSALMSSKIACGKRANSSDSSGSGDAETLRPAAAMAVDPERVELLLGRHVLVSKQQALEVAIDPLAPVITWHEGADFTCALVPMLACKKPDHTAGLGDNISGTGMAYHRLKPRQP
ncbi:hypothetical protein PybrP1_005065 [[Pythium] brassicae (nom. inval.)]|nr:hypothetical protein PybrP1_005065 [[Pythium] brassicae (nom. inval.)]